MKLKILALTLLLPAFAAAAEDCSKASDACTAAKKSLSPFLAAAAAEPEAPVPAAKPAPAPKTAAAPVPAAPVVEVSTAAPAAPAGRQASSPAWLLLVAGGLAGLYFYLAGGRRRGRRK